MVLSLIDSERERLMANAGDLATQSGMAAKIQAQYRGRSVRQSLDDLKEEAEMEYSAASYIAGVYRGHLTRRRLEQAKDDPRLSI